MRRHEKKNLYPHVSCTGCSGDTEQLIDHTNALFSVFLDELRTPKDNMVAGSVLQRLVVAHPALTNPVRIR